MTTPIGDTLTFSTAGDTKSVLNIPTDGIYTDNIYFDCSSSQDYLGICDIKITAYYFVESTKDDYDIEEWVDATNGRVIKSGTIYAIKSQAKPAYTEKSWTTAGTYTFTVPDGITRLRVVLCGGGAGKGSLFSNGKGGGNTSAFGITATGGHGGGVAFRKGAGGEPNGHASTGNNVTDGFALSFDKSSGNYGKGGNFGGSGGYDSQYVTVTAGVIQMEGNDVDVYLLDTVAWSHISEKKAYKYEQQYTDWCRKMLRVIERCGVHKTLGSRHSVPVYSNFIHNLEIVDKENSCTWLVSFADNTVAVPFTNGSKELIVPVIENSGIVNKIKSIYTNKGGNFSHGQNLLAVFTSAPEKVVLSDSELADIMHVCVINVEFSEDMYGFWPVPPKGCRKDSAKITVPETTLSFPKPKRGRNK